MALATAPHDREVISNVTVAVEDGRDRDVARAGRLRRGARGAA